MATPLRVYVPAHGGIYYIESPYVQYGVNGERSRSPVNGQPQHKDSIWTKEQEQKGLLVIDNNLTMNDCYGVEISSAKPSGKRGAEYGQIRAIITTTDVAKVTVGLGSEIPAHLPGAFYLNKDTVAITGTYGANTLKAIGDLANLNTIAINRIHHEASSESVFLISPTMTVATSVGGSSNILLNFPQSDSDDENTNIRDMKPEYLKSQGFESGLCFNGMNYLTYTLPANESVTLTFYTVFTPK